MNLILAAIKRKLLPESYLTFIGENGSMNLKHGKVYQVKILTHGSYIWVTWKPDPEPRAAHQPPNCCPYSSVEALARNWRLPKEGDEK